MYKIYTNFLRGPHWPVPKILLAMKLTIFLLIISLMQVNAAATAQQINFSKENVTLRQVFKEIKKQTGYDVFWGTKKLKDDDVLNAEFKNASLDDVLRKCLDGKALQYKVYEKTIIITDKPEVHINKTESSVQPIKLSGTVKDTTGVPIPGASIFDKTKGSGAASDLKGAFVITVEPGDVLVISSVGYIKQEITAGTATTLNVVLKEEKSQLATVVVTALGISKEARKIGYAVTTVNGDLLNQAKEPNVANSLEGRVSGLDVSGTNSGPGSSSRLLIRGISNFTGTTGPLFVIDGVPMDNTQKGSAGTYGGADMGDGISSINPDDIENVVVLKGSTASALYGTRASNGVILITTKSGKNAKGFGIEYSGNYSVNSIVDNTDYQKVFGAGVNGQRPQTAADLVNDGLNSWGGILDGSPSIEMDGKMHPYSPVQGQLSKFY